MKQIVSFENFKTSSDLGILDEAINAYCRKFSDSIICEMRSHFDSLMVIRFLKFFEGQVVSFPSIKTIWKNFRNQYITAIIKKQVREEAPGIDWDEIKEAGEIYQEIISKGSKNMPRVKREFEERQAEIIQQEIREKQFLSKNAKIRVLKENFTDEFIANFIEHFGGRVLRLPTLKRIHNAWIEQKMAS